MEGCFYLECLRSEMIYQSHTASVNMCPHVLLDAFAKLEVREH